ncbi:LLM class flavin-dependent oxidoreductase [Amycolatopsis acidiphila]|uniref:LLM class flavin-dependent oxidoreductase n=1 Tax=Amycolatopsis acidiphila TaxID=715473 RepID=A0A558A6D5_9PSEU|nr:LLM class flavin-dependent oxidoreductase [Amycolatopsis acidiphila]TVT19831.1 LLM class flavin-dependent oxidoreductase [Amycolatopsis acidiphila]UIJ58735.1 LLM class flavin-dependent oxidoreductase [Amycolatopsis acidiphila]GHG71647.1 5,10-methylenetetrahydromethanopterin reductase [Amycolatopsis acidiphila]
MSIKVDIRVPVGRPLPELATFIRSCEDAGFHGVGVNDHHHSGRDVYAVLALATAATERLTLFPATSNPVTRHPLVLAATANSLAEIGPGRAMLTLAPGFLSVEKAGKPQARRQQLAEAVTAIRNLLAGRPATVDGAELRMNNTTATPPKVFVLAAGPKMLELAGEHADGVMMLVGLHPDSIAAAREHLRAGERRAGRAPGSVEEIFIVPTAIESFETAREWPRRFYRPGKQFLCYPSASNLRWLRAAGLDIPEDHDPAAISPELAAEVCEAFGLFGPPEYCADRLLRAQQESGVEHVFFFPSHTAESAYDLPQADVEAFHKIIGPRLAE